MIESQLDAAATTLLERSAELRALDDALQAMHEGRGRLVIIEGEPGIGKTSLVRQALRAAEARNVAVLRATPREMESGYAYGLVLELFGPLLARPSERAALLVGAAARVAPVFGSTSSSDGLRAVDAFPIIHGLYWLTAGLAERGPLLLAVDDAQWADAASLRFLGYLAQRVAELPVMLLVALRPALLDEPEEVSMLRTLGAPGAMRPAPLSLDAVRSAIGNADLSAGRGHVNGRSLDEDFVEACHRVTRGNPFYLHELLRQVNVFSSDPARWDELAPEAITRRVARRVATIGTEAVQVAAAAAILAGDATLARIARMADLPLEVAARAIDRLTAANLVDGGRVVGFVHPIVRGCVEQSIPRQERGLQHQRAAKLLAETGGSLDAVAAHLLEAPPAASPWTVRFLSEAALSAASRGDPERAIACLRRALDEPPSTADCPGVLVDLGRALALAGDGVGSAEVLAEAAGRVSDPGLRATICCEEGEALQSAGRWGAAAAAFDRGLRVLPSSTQRADEIRSLEALRGRLEAGFVAAAWLDRSQHVEAERRADSILALPDGASGAPLVALWTAYQHAVQASGGRDRALDLVHQAIDGIPIRELQAMGQAVELAAGTLLAADALEEDAALLTAAMQEAQHSGSLAKYAVASYCRSWPNLHCGRVPDAVADAQAAVDALDSGWEMFYPAACTVLCLALIERGDLDAAAAAIDLDPERWGDRLDYVALVPLARGRLQLARGEARAAAGTFLGDAAGVADLGIRNPDLSAWRSWGATALARIGRRDEALRLASEELEIARDWGAPRQLGWGLRALGLATGGEAGITHLREAVEVLRTSPARLELARATCDLGTLLRVVGKRDEARLQLAAAADLAERCGSVDLRMRAAGELRAAGARPRRHALSGPEALTPAELRVARLAAEGRTNREVAEALFVTLKAVEFHLANVYPKLGIASRRELAGALGEAPTLSAARR